MTENLQKIKRVESDFLSKFLWASNMSLLLFKCFNLEEASGIILDPIQKTMKIKPLKAALASSQIAQKIYYPLLS
jgi:hypothetical protein